MYNNIACSFDQKKPLLGPGLHYEKMDECCYTTSQNRIYSFRTVVTQDLFLISLQETPRILLQYLAAVPITVN